MQRGQSDELVEKIHVIWRLESTVQDRKRAKEVWWEFLHDLELDSVRKVLNHRAMYGGYAPRPGEIRTEVLIGRVPLVSDIWEELQAVRAKINSGQYVDEPYSEWTALVVKRLGGQSMGLQTNGDRSMLSDVLKRILEDRTAECLPTLPPN